VTGSPTILGIFVKQPIAGSVKTRLAAHLGPELAAEISHAFVLDLSVRFRRTAHRRSLCYAPSHGESRRHFQSLAGEAYELWPQPEGGLGARMAAFFEAHLGGPSDRAVLIGSDSPTLPADYIEQAFRSLEHADCVLGPATDGGYYLVGMRGRCWPLFEGIEWSSPRVLSQTVERVVSAEARLALLPPWYDVDTVADWEMLRGHAAALRHAGGAGELEATLRVLRRS
jgi:hypothetical protein